MRTAQANFETTKALIRDSRWSCRPRPNKGSALRGFTDLSLFSGTVADNDKFLRSLIENGSATAVEPGAFLEQNEVNLGEFVDNLVTTNEVTVKHPSASAVLVDVPLRGGRRLHRAGQPAGQLRLPLRADPHRGADGVREGLRHRRHPLAAEPG